MAVVACPVGDDVTVSSLPVSLLTSLGDVRGEVRGEVLDDVLCVAGGAGGSTVIGAPEPAGLSVVRTVSAASRGVSAGEPGSAETVVGGVINGVGTGEPTAAEQAVSALMSSGISAATRRWRTCTS